MDNHNQNEREEIYSKPIRAGKRTYFFDVKATRSDDLYITVTESKKRLRDDGTFFFEKHKIFLYKEDFDKFREGLEEAINFISERQPLSDEHTEKVGKGEYSDIDFDDLEK